MINLENDLKSDNFLFKMYYDYIVTSLQSFILPLRTRHSHLHCILGELSPLLDLDNLVKVFDQPTKCPQSVLFLCNKYYGCIATALHSFLLTLWTRPSNLHCTLCELSPLLDLENAHNKSYIYSTCTIIA